ncbi:MAG: hypothetical protein HQ513_15385 [Rhodospirillales bacterium]|nr:hypothetical protein [Rhodospirillales bacterium]
MTKSYSQELCKVIDSLCGEEKFNPSLPEVPLIEAGLDSLDYVSVLMALEDKYDIEIPQSSESKLWSLNDLVGFIETAVRQS